MKKIPTLFVRKFEGHKIVDITPELNGPFERVLEGKTVPTMKYDGACCMIKDGVLYKRFDAKKGRKIPEGAIPCQTEPDPITGHWPFWVIVDAASPSDKWFMQALDSYRRTPYVLTDGTYEAVGKHFNGNPYCTFMDCLIRHGADKLCMRDFSFEGIRKYLTKHNIEGIVFWEPDMSAPICKIKRSDFGLPWPDDWTKYE